jgi:hypothetical protein
MVASAAKNILVVDYNHYDLPDKITESTMIEFGKIIAEEVSKQKEEVNYIIVPSMKIVSNVCARCGTLENYFTNALNEKIKGGSIKFISSGFGYRPGNLKDRLEVKLGKLNVLDNVYLTDQFVLYEVTNKLIS